MQRAGIVLALLAWLSPTFAGAEERPGFTTAGALPAAELQALDARGAATLTAGGKKTTYAPAELVVWGAYVEPRRGPLVVLTDGSWFVADLIGLTSDEIRVDARLFGELALPRAAVRGILFRLSTDLEQRDRLLDRIAARRDAEDLLVLANGDELTGQATGQKYDAVANEERLLFQRPASKEPAVLPLHRLSAIAFDSLLGNDAAAGAIARAGFRDGSQLLIAAVARQADRYELTTAAGVKVQIDQDALADDVTCWQPQNERIAYLSDLPDAGYKHIPFLTQDWPYHQDRNCHGLRLRTADHLVFKGLGMHSTSRLAYELEGDYRSFAAELALDRSAGDRGSVIYRLFTAGEDGAWKTAYQSPIVRGGAAPLPITVELAGARRIALIVDFAERGDERDDANWLNARLIR